jgi:hypothetical protein
MGRSILWHLKKYPFSSIRQILKTLNLTISPTCLYSWLKKNNYVVKSPSKRIVLNERLKLARIEWCFNHFNLDFKNVIFSDEKKFNLRGPDGFNKYWGHTSDINKIINRSHFEGAGLMVHVSVSYSGVIAMCEITGILNSEKYIELLNLSVFPLILPFEEHKDFIWQQDNAPIHNSKLTLRYFHNMGIRKLDWPARSPDLNIVENIFSYMSEII